MWFSLALISGLASAIDKVLNRHALKNRNNALAYSVIYLFLTATFTLPFVFPLKIDLTQRLFLLILAQSGIWAVASVLGFAAHKSTDVSLSSIISRARILWLIPLGFLFLDERLSLYSILGVMLIFFGLAMLFYKGNIHKHKGVHLVLISSVFAAFGSVTNAILVREYLNPAQVTFTTMFGQAVVLLIVLILRGKSLEKIKDVLSHSWLITLIATMLEAFAYITLSSAYKIGLASSVTAVYMAVSIVVVWFGILFLKERNSLKSKIISSILVTLGVILVRAFG